MCQSVKVDNIQGSFHLPSLIENFLTCSGCVRSTDYRFFLHPFALLKMEQCFASQHGKSSCLVLLQGAYDL